MLNVQWPELENNFGSAGPPSEAFQFKLSFFQELRNRLAADTNGEYIVDTVSRILKTLLSGGWDALTPAQVMEVVESVTDRILPLIDFPGPFDSVIKPIIRTAIFKVAEALAAKYLEG